MKLRSDIVNMDKISDSGQIFRFVRDSEDTLELIARDRFLHIYRRDDGDYELDCDKKSYDSYWKYYFDIDTDYDKFISNIPKSDRFLTNAAKFSRGMKILNQDAWEMLISFIISQRKSIPAIRTSIERLSSLCGKKIKDGKNPRYAFPTAKAIASLSIDELYDCGLGYRAPYIYKVAHEVISGDIDLDSMKDMTDDELLSSLMDIYGIGVKVANCVMLFGYHRIGAFPIDVWIKRVIDKYYDGRFPLERYDGYAGVLQQYMFFYERNGMHGGYNV